MYLSLQGDASDAVQAIEKADIAKDYTLDTGNQMEQTCKTLGRFQSEVPRIEGAQNGAYKWSPSCPYKWSHTFSC